MVSFVFWKDIKWKMIVTWIYEYGPYWEITVHHYLTQYVIILDIQNRFIKYKEQICTCLHGFFCSLERYQMKNSSNTDLRIWTILDDHKKSLLNSIDLHLNTLFFSINQFSNGCDNLFLIGVSVIVVVIIIVVVFFFSSFFVLFCSSS